MRPAQGAQFLAAVSVLPCVELDASLQWWTEKIGFEVAFSYDGYAGIQRGGVNVHLVAMDDKALARTVGDQTMLRLEVGDVTAFHAEYAGRGGEVHPNGPLTTKPWGTQEFGAIDPCGVCVTFFEAAKE
jgi:catechol 2,3-dioxygenase-like lactoylglutathione lyase family enzyme